MHIPLQQIAALCTLFFCLIPYAIADCGYQLKYVAPEGASRDYALSEIRNFVVSEVRPRLSQTERRDWIKITRVCNGVISNVGLQIQTDDYYLTNVDGFEVGEDVYKYDEQNLEISKDRFGYYFSATEAFQQKTKDEQRRILKYFAYIFAESARFEAIEERLDDLFIRDCRVNWAESKRLFRRWARLSTFSKEAKIADHKYTGGKNNNLYAPISKAVMTAYSSEALDGKNAPLDQYIDPKDFGWKFSYDTPSCSADQVTKQEERDEILTLLAFNVILNDWQTGDTPQRRGHNIGSVLADQNGYPIFWSRNANKIRDDSSQHGEVRLIQNYLTCDGVADYATGLTVYTTLEPCAMCSGMMTLTQISRVVYGQSDPGYGGAAKALLSINYPNVYEDSPLVTSDFKKKVDASYKVWSASAKGGVTSFLLSDDAKILFAEAATRLTSYKVRHAENAAILSEAIKFAKTANLEDPSKGLLVNCQKK